MSIQIGNGVCITYMETLVACPICTFKFDVSKAAYKAPIPVFKMKCPACKSKVGISMPIFGGNTIAFEWDAPKAKVERLITVTPNKFNGEEIPIK